MQGPGAAFEGAGDVGGDPAAVEVPRLRGDAFSVDIAGVHGDGEEGDVLLEERVTRDGVFVGPRRAVGTPVSDDDVVVIGVPFPLAVGLPRDWLQAGHVDVSARDVVARRVGRLEEADRVARFGEGVSRKLDPDQLGCCFDARWPRIAPDGFLTRSGRMRLGVVGANGVVGVNGHMRS